MTILSLTELEDRFFGICGRKVEMYNWTELNEIADGMGDFTYTVTPRKR